MRDKLIDLITIGIARYHVQKTNGNNPDMAAIIADVLMENNVSINEWKFADQISEPFDYKDVCCGESWNNDVYKTITFESDEVVDEKSYEAFTYLAGREELRELLISAYPPLSYNMAGGMEAATHLANVILAAGYRKTSNLAEEIFEEIENINAHGDGYYEYWKDWLAKLAELKKKYTESEKDK